MSVKRFSMQAQRCMGEPWQDIEEEEDGMYVLATDYDALTASLLIERGKLEKADAENDRLTARVAALEVQRSEIIRVTGARVKELMQAMNYIRTVCDNNLDTDPNADADRGCRSNGHEDPDSTGQCIHCGKILEDDLEREEAERNREDLARLGDAE